MSATKNTKHNDPRIAAFNGKGLLDVNDIENIFECGRSKARLVMNKLPHFRFGKKELCYTVDLIDYIDKNGGIVVKWER